MRSAKPVKRVLLGLLVLCILLAGGWYLLTPFPIGKAMSPISSTPAGMVSSFTPALRNA